MGARSRRIYHAILKGIQTTLRKTGHVLIKALIFLSLLEDGPYVRLSISKIYMWVSIFALVYVLLHDITNVAAVLAAGGNQIIATLNYELRRRSFNKTGELKDVDDNRPNWQEHYGVRNRFPDYSARMRSGAKSPGDSEL